MPGLKVNKSEHFNRIKYPPSVYKNTILNGVPKKKIMKKQIKDLKNRIRDLSEISRGRGREGGNFKFGFGNYVTHPCNGSFANPPLELGLKIS